MPIIREQSVISVLLNDGWHKVNSGSFKIDISAISGLATGAIDLGETATWQESFHTSEKITVTAKLDSVLAIQYA
jgi:hypothetical protein